MLKPKYRFKRPPLNAPGTRRRSLSRSLTSLVLLIVLIGGSILLQGPDGTVAGDDGREITGPVRAGDGDSLNIGATRIRLHGIDAVELAQHCKDAAGQDHACGAEAQRALEDLVRNRVVRCDERHGVDQYGRIAAVCTADGIDLNAAMVDAGYAVAYRQHSLAYVPNEDRTKAAKKGLWAGSFQMPWDWRRHEIGAE